MFDARIKWHHRKAVSFPVRLFHFDPVQRHHMRCLVLLSLLRRGAMEDFHRLRKHPACDPNGVESRKENAEFWKKTQ